MALRLARNIESSSYQQGADPKLERRPGQQGSCGSLRSDAAVELLVDAAGFPSRSAVLVFMQGLLCWLPYTIYFYILLMEHTDFDSSEMAGPVMVCAHRPADDVGKPQA